MTQPWQHKVFEPRLLAAWSQVGTSFGETAAFPPMDRMFHRDLQTLQGVAFHSLSSDPTAFAAGGKRGTVELLSRDFGSLSIRAMAA